MNEAERIALIANLHNMASQTNSHSLPIPTAILDVGGAILRALFDLTDAVREPRVTVE